MSDDRARGGTLVVIFGAGASFDSNPDVPVGGFDEDRPPLANNLFDMDREATKAAAAAFPRAAPALMAARAAVKAGATIEGTLTRLQAEAEDDPHARSQLMALRFYLQRVLTQVPDAWDAKAVRQTTYVSMLDQLARWQRETDRRLCLITFNYDLLLERACTIVYGHQFAGMDSYLSGPGFRLYKPHGSVDWAQPASWRGSVYSDPDAARRAICDDPDLTAEDEYVQRSATDRVIWRERQHGLVAWLPAIAIPVERKPAVLLSADHRAALEADLSDAVAVLAVGWRAREDHFLQVLQHSLPGSPLPMVAVAESRDAARETVDNVWRTGRFDSFGLVNVGFSAFAAPESPVRRPAVPAQDRVHRRDPVLADLLRNEVPMTRMAPGSGVEASPVAAAPVEPVAGYVPLG
jgi:hypothetical protein